MQIEKVLIINNEPPIFKSLEEQLRSHRCSVVVVKTKAEAEIMLNKNVFDLVFLDSHLPDGEGRELLKYINEFPNLEEKPLVTIITGYGSIKSAVESIQLGAFDYILKPFSLQEIEGVLKKAESYQHLEKVNQFFSTHQDNAQEFLGNSDEIKGIRNLIQKVAKTEVTVLITGENGTGKEMVAHEIYRQSHLAGKPYITVNCAAIAENLIESEFFGHEKGSFTHALRRHIGRFELAHNGTILLDEIAEIAPHLQSKLLRVLQEKEFERVGGTQTLKVNVRVLASTNRNLKQLVKEGTFREDLYYRLNVFPIEIPPLRERKSDILLLANFFLNRYTNKHKIQLNGFSPESQQLLLNHRWPGNVRELQNVVERAVILSNGLPFVLPNALNLPNFSEILTLKDVNDPDLIQCTSLEEIEKQHIFRVLHAVQGNRLQAAKLLQVTTRTLHNKLTRYHYSFKDFKKESVLA